MSGTEGRVLLPVATPTEVRRYAGALLRTQPGPWAVTLGLHALAAVAGLAMPWLIGTLVEKIRSGTTIDAVDRIALAIVAAVTAQAVLTRFAKLTAARLGERMLAQLREDFVRRILAIPLSTVERSGTGDLLTRTSRDIDSLSHSVRFAVPEILIATVTLVFSLGALALVGPQFLIPCLLGAADPVAEHAVVSDPSPGRLSAGERRLFGHDRRARRDGRRGPNG